MIETICQYPQQVVMGASALIGALGYAGFAIARKKKEDGKKFNFDAKKIIDTVWQSTTAGIVASAAIGCSWQGIAIAVMTGIGIDRIANAFKINKKQVLNLVEWVIGSLAKK